MYIRDDEFEKQSLGQEEENICPYFSMCPYCQTQSWDFRTPFPPMPPQPPPMPGSGAGPSTSPPPFTPKKSNVGSPQLKAVSPGSIKPCTYEFVYIWLENGSSFWAWLTKVDRRSASGFKWNGRKWVYFGVDLRKIDSFICY